VARELRAAEAAALQPVADGVWRQLGLSRKCRGAPALRLTCRPIAQAISSVVVPPSPRVVGGAVDDLVAQIGVLEADSDELDQILGLDPDRQAPLIDGLVVEVADADCKHAQPMLVGIERAERLAERLAHAIARIRARDCAGAEAPPPRIEAEHMVRRGEN